MAWHFQKLHKSQCENRKRVVHVATFAIFDDWLVPMLHKKSSSMISFMMSGNGACIRQGRELFAEHELDIPMSV